MTRRRIIHSARFERGVAERGEAWGATAIVVFYVFDEQEVELLGISRLGA